MSSARNSPARPSIREQIAAKRAEVRNSPLAKSARVGTTAGSGGSSSLGGVGSPLAARRTTAGGSTARGAVGGRGGFGITGDGSEGVVEEKTVDGQIKKAVKSAKLDISSLSLKRIPAEVYTKLLGLQLDELSSPPPPPSPPSSKKGDIFTTPRQFGSEFPTGLEKEDERALIFGKSLKKGEEFWVEPEELTTFRAAGNELEVLEREMGMFGGLKSVDLSRNRLRTIPNCFSDLLRLTTLDLSNNAISSLPPSILLLPLLQVLDLSHNSLTTLSFSDTLGPSEDGLAYGVGFFSTAVQRAEELKAVRPIWPVLRSMNLGYNRLDSDGLAELANVKLKAMRVLNLEYNALQGVLDVAGVGIGEESMPQLATLVFNGNKALRGIKGELGRDAKVETVGCSVREGSIGPAPTKTEDPITPAPASAEVTDDSSAPTSHDDSANPIPNPNLTYVYRTLPAATFDSEPLAIDFDLYLPSAPAGPAGHPLVIWFHGGGLLQGNKENLPPHFRRLPSFTLGSGDEHVAVISPNYRLAPQVPILEILSDVTALLTYIRTKLNDRLTKEGKGEHKIDTGRICLSGGSAGGYLALIAGMEVPKEVKDEEVGGYRGVDVNSGIKCLAPFYPITDLTDEFWATETNPVPWMKRTVAHAEAKPHLDTKAAPVFTAVSGGPRSILYPYMLQHALFPSLLFLTQRSVGSGLDGFRPSPLALSIPHRLELVAKSGKVKHHVPIYFVYGTIDDKVQPMEKTLQAFEKVEGELEVCKLEGKDHAFDEDPTVECEEFREWLGKHLL
ncbi:hypothetical protein CI109_102430 [Kwoniella shandongensis]|uniref:BD-FAE-like domain-containing protein n=1 Tax=Kwoniella shandongensis TaxID=1734106 RepID=A0A5M6C3A9_9TREE|nr:uncharacterized protein CI109_003251 [Kwoniella shandongensis]KAA5528352.1 hypothetical protein CI109_003251 [Kwoniella shandongensis]